MGTFFLILDETEVADILRMFVYEIKVFFIKMSDKILFIYILLIINNK